jgi:DNA-binding NtrC family response regulator
MLVVEDDTDARQALAELLRRRGFAVETARDGFKALPKLTEYDPDVLLTDLRMPGMDGLALVRKALELDPHRVAIVMTAFGAIESAVAAMRQGATDYVTKPIHIEHLVEVVQPLLARRRRLREAVLRRPDPPPLASSIVGASPPLRAALATLLQVAPSGASVLITGESGTGKGLMAAALHRHSSRHAGPFVTLHCAALADGVLESELFGHERGAFTGASAGREGRFAQADGGTLFLDEIGDIPLATQVKLLRFVQERSFERVGGTRTMHVDVRIVAATNADLQERVRQGRFREDLYYRLNVVSIAMPPLRERPDDIPLLAGHLLGKYTSENDRDIRGFTPEAMDRLLAHPWPGNVRELENAIEGAVVLCRGDEIRAADLPATLQNLATPVRPSRTAGTPTLAEMERQAILAALEESGGCTSQAALRLGVSQRTIQYRLRSYSAGRPS